MSKIGIGIQCTGSIGNLVAAGPLTKQPGTKPLRVVLVDLDHEYAVYTEIFEDEAVCDSGSTTSLANSESVPRSSLEQGQYISKFGLSPADALIYATNAWLSKLTKSMIHWPSIDRVDSPKLVAPVTTVEVLAIETN